MSDYPIPSHPTWDIIDSSKIQEFLECPRRYFYRYMLGWKSEVPNNHLVFGEAWHKAMEVLQSNDYSDDSIITAFEAFMETYRRDFPESTDELYSPKTPDRVLEALPAYVQEYRNDPKEFEILYVEVAGTVSLDTDRHLAFRQDTICRGHEGIFSLEHKTAGKTLDRKWAMQWPIKTQVGTYTHVLYCLFPDEEIYGVKMNGAGFLKTKFSFMRVPIRKTRSSMQVWLWNTLYWMDQIYWNMEKLSQCKDSDPLLLCFPMNTESCTKYYGCLYHDYCTSWQNPLRHCDEIPIGIKRDFWNPLEKESRHRVEEGVLVK